jgi:hypothetical protein
MDIGGELGRYEEVLDLLTQAGYAVEQTAPNSSNQNGPVKRPHRDTGICIHAMLSGPSLLAVCVSSFPSAPQHEHSR